MHWNKSGIFSNMFVGNIHVYMYTPRVCLNRAECTGLCGVRLQHAHLDSAEEPEYNHDPQSLHISHNVQVTCGKVVGVMWSGVLEYRNLQTWDAVKAQSLVQISSMTIPSRRGYSLLRPFCELSVKFWNKTIKQINQSKI